MMMRTRATAMVKMVDMAMTRAVARCPWPKSSAAVGREGRDSGLGPPCEAAAPVSSGPAADPPGDPRDPKRWLRLRTKR